jgi:2-iminobutanoate/2-iminopropanoate deaminase
MLFLERMRVYMSATAREVIYTENAPKGRGPFPQALKAGQFLFVSGQGPLDAKTNTPDTGSFDKEVRLTLENIRHIVAAAGMTMQDAVRITVYLTDLANIPEFNKIYEEYFPDKRPARTLVQVGLRGIQVEMEAMFWNPN